MNQGGSKGVLGSLAQGPAELPPRWQRAEAQQDKGTEVGMHLVC